MKIAAIGECLAELTSPGGSSFTLSFAGDVYNTAVYLGRLSKKEAEVHFITALGSDWLSDRQLAAMQTEGLIVDAIRVPEASPALYFVQTDKTGERSFTYYRDASPVKKILSAMWDPQLTDHLHEFDLIYFSAITLQMLEPTGRTALTALLHEARARGTKIAFDSNYRPRGWRSPDDARTAIAEALSVTDIALPSLDDELLLHPGDTADAVLERYTRAGVAEIVLKNGGGPVYTSHNGVTTMHPTPAAPRPRDTTGAGDSFNAGYLLARVEGLDIADAIADGQKIAAVVIASPGAIIEANPA